MKRRNILGTVGVTIPTATAGCAGILSDDDAAPDDCPAVVDDGKSSGNPSQNVRIDVTVESEGGDSLEGIEVKLEDRGGTPDDRFGTTCSDGTIRFVEGTGPSPCNRLTLKLPEHGQEASLGCHNGEAELEHTFTVES